MATEQQIPKLAGAIVEHQSGFAALSTEDAQWVITETKNAIAVFVEAVKQRAKTAAAKLLQFLETVAVPTVKEFAADEHFKDGEDIDGVTIYISDNFKKRFCGKVEKNVAGCGIRVHRLTRTSRDLDIRYELGENNEETLLAHLWHLLKLRGNRGGWFIFYIRDSEGVLWAVRAFRFGGYWSVDARSVERRDRWIADLCVCSR